MNTTRYKNVSTSELGVKSNDRLRLRVIEPMSHLMLYLVGNSSHASECLGIRLKCIYCREDSPIFSRIIISLLLTVYNYYDSFTLQRDA